MTENGRPGPPAHVVEAMRGGDPYAQMQPQGPFYPQPAPQPSQAAPPPEVFDAGDFWKAGYDFTKAGVNATGEIPMPSQAKIDRYERTDMLLRGELDKLEREVLRPFEAMQEEYDQAEFNRIQARSGGNLEEAAKWKAEMDRLQDAAGITEEMADSAMARKAEVLSNMKDAVAALCSNKPTRKQLDGLPENIFIPFKNYVDRLLNPNA